MRAAKAHTGLVNSVGIVLWNHTEGGLGRGAEDGIQGGNAAAAGGAGGVGVGQEGVVVAARVTQRGGFQPELFTEIDAIAWKI
jgi:hypothetical protein